MRLIDADALIEDVRKSSVSYFADDFAKEWVNKQPTVEPMRKKGRWILDRSGAYCCSECMEPCASYVMMKPRDKFCKMCGSYNGGDADETDRC